MRVFRVFREHTGWQKVRPWITANPGKLLAFGLLLALGFWYLSPWLSVTPARARYGPSETPPLPTPLPLQKDQEANALLQDQKTVETLEHDLKASQKQVHELRQSLGKLEHAQKDGMAQVLQKLDTIDKRTTDQAGQKAAASTKTATPVRPGPTEREKQLQAQVERLTQAQKTTTQPPRTERYGTMQIYSAKHLDLPTPAAPNRADIPYLGIGCVGPFTLATGGDTTINTDRSRPVLLSITEPFRCAGKMVGPDQLPVPTMIPVQGCVALAGLKADVAGSRAIGETMHLACTMPDRSYFERPFRAYIVDADGNSGLIGEAVRHETTKIFAAALSSVMQEASALLAAARSNIVVSGTPNSGQQYFSGIQSGFNQMTTFFLEQARNLTPTVFVHRGQRGYVVVLEGLPMEGMPTVNTVSQQRGF